MLVFALKPCRSRLISVTPATNQIGIPAVYSTRAPQLANEQARRFEINVTDLRRGAGGQLDLDPRLINLIVPAELLTGQGCGSSATCRGQHHRRFVANTSVP